MHQLWKWAVEEDEIDRSPMERMKPPRVPDSPIPVIAPADFGKLLKTAEGQEFVARRDTAIMLTLFDTGMRLGEPAGLRFEDVDLQGQLAYASGKGGHTRAVRFGTKTAVALDRYVRQRRGHRFAGAGAFWLGPDAPITPSEFAQMIAKRCTAAGLPRLHPHQFRHTFAHEYLADGGAGGRPTAARRLALARDAPAWSRCRGRPASCSSGCRLGWSSRGSPHGPRCWPGGT